MHRILPVAIALPALLGATWAQRAPAAEAAPPPGDAAAEVTLVPLLEAQREITTRIVMRLVAADQFRAAAVALDEVLPGLTGDPEWEHWAHYTAGACFLEGNQLDLASTHLERAVRLAPFEEDTAALRLSVQLLRDDKLLTAAAQAHLARLDPVKYGADSEVIFGAIAGGAVICVNLYLFGSKAYDAYEAWDVGDRRRALDAALDAILTLGPGRAANAGRSAAVSAARFGRTALSKLRSSQ